MQFNYGTQELMLAAQRAVKESAQNKERAKLLRDKRKAKKAERKARQRAQKRK